LPSVRFDVCGERSRISRIFEFVFGNDGKSGLFDKWRSSLASSEAAAAADSTAVQAKNIRCIPTENDEIHAHSSLKRKALPACYGPFERATFVQACAIAGLPVNEVVVDLDAAALQYAVYVASLTAASQNSSSTEAQGKKILFADAGAFHVAASAIQISPKGKIEILDRT
jgi:hypothetical protein